MKDKRGQIGIEYLVIMGFIFLTLIGLLGIGFKYTEEVNDQIIMIQTNNLAENILTNSEKVFYQGEPSKATITVYIPKQINKIEIIENSLVIEIQTSTGINKRVFPCNVPINGTLNSIEGSRRIRIIADSNQVNINQI